jgi:hypothetical protein
MTIITQQRHVKAPQGRERHEIKKLSRRRRRFAAAALLACFHGTQPAAKLRARKKALQ